MCFPEVTKWSEEKNACVPTRWPAQICGSGTELRQSDQVCVPLPCEERRLGASAAGSGPAGGWAYCGRGTKWTGPPEKKCNIDPQFKACNCGLGTTYSLETKVCMATETASGWCGEGTRWDGGRKQCASTLKLPGLPVPRSSRVNTHEYPSDHFFVSAVKEIVPAKGTTSVLNQVFESIYVITCCNNRARVDLMHKRLSKERGIAFHLFDGWWEAERGRNATRDQFDKYAQHGRVMRDGNFLRALGKKYPNLSQTELQQAWDNTYGVAGAKLSGTKGVFISQVSAWHDAWRHNSDHGWSLFMESDAYFNTSDDRVFKDAIDSIYRDKVPMPDLVFFGYCIVDGIEHITPVNEYWVQFANTLCLHGYALSPKGLDTVEEKTLDGTWAYAPIDTAVRAACMEGDLLCYVINGFGSNKQETEDRGGTLKHLQSKTSGYILQRAAEGVPHSIHHKDNDVFMGLGRDVTDTELKGLKDAIDIQKSTGKGEFTMHNDITDEKIKHKLKQFDAKASSGASTDSGKEGVG